MQTGGRERLAGERAYATVSGEVFDRADLSSVCLDRVRLRGASLRFARLAGCDLSEADLRDCDLTGASFGFVNTGAVNGLSDLTGALLDGAVLIRATFDRVVGWPPR